MDATITGRHMEVTDAMESQIEQHLQKLQRFDSYVQYLTITLSVDGSVQRVEIVGKCKRHDLLAESKTHDMYAAIDEAFAKLTRQIARDHDKMVHNPARAAQRAAEIERRAQ